MIDLLKKLQELKRVEKEVKTAQDAIKKQISDKLECDLGSSKTHTIENFKVTVKKPLNFKIDNDEWKALEKTLPKEHRPVRTQVKLDMEAYRFLEKSNTEAFLKVSRAVTATPGKVNVTVEEKKNGI